MNTVQKRGTLSGDLIAVKGQARLDPLPSAPDAPSAPVKLRAEPVLPYKSMTFKLDKDRYTRLKQLGVWEETTSQDLVTRALDMLLAQYPKLFSS